MTADQADAVLRQAFCGWMEMRREGIEPRIIRAAADVYPAFEMHYDAFVHPDAPQFAGVVLRTATVVCEPLMAPGTLVLQ